ncbi:CARDB domain-containing protein, partial [Chloroflexota bacterium]
MAKGQIVGLGIIKRIIIIAAVLALVSVLGAAVAGPRGAEVAAAEPQPDLIIQDITLSPENPSLGDTATFTVTIKNQGAGAAGLSRVAYSIDDDDLALEYVDSIDAGTTVTGTFIWNAQAGSHTFKAGADANSQVAEADETNNAKTFTFTTLAADLTIESITWTPEDPSRGDTVTFSVTVMNQGNDESRSTNINFYVDGKSRGYQDVYSIEAGDTITRTYTWPAAVGQHDIRAVVDEANNIEESDEANNEQSLIFSTLLPDLVIEDVTWSPENPSKNDDVTFTVTVKNQGSGRSDSCHITYYVGEVCLTTDYISPIESGVSTNMTFAWTALASSHDIQIIVDYYEKVVESDEDNNENTVTFLTLAPDLIVQDVTWEPTDAAAGDDVTFTVTIRNQGSGKAENSRAGCYISSYYSGYLDIPEMEAGAVVSRTFVWSAVVGSHVVNVMADYDDKIVESSDDNNRQTTTIAISPPDLVVQ